MTRKTSITVIKLCLALLSTSCYFIKFADANTVTRLTLTNKAGENVLDRKQRHLLTGSGVFDLKVYVGDEEVAACLGLEPVAALCPIDGNVKIDHFTKNGKESSTNEYKCRSFQNSNLECLLVYHDDGTVSGDYMKDEKHFHFEGTENDIKSEEMVGNDEFVDEYVLENGKVVRDTHHVNQRDLQQTRRNLFQLEPWEGCYPHMDGVNEFFIGVAVSSNLMKKKWGTVEKALRMIEELFIVVNGPFVQQLRVKIHIKHIMIVAADNPGGVSWDSGGCSATSSATFDAFVEYNRPGGVGTWLLLDDCAGGFAGKAILKRICGEWSAVAMAYASKASFFSLTVTHELGHNFGMYHTFQEGAGQTGGIMDYNEDGTLDGVFQFNEKWSRGDVCNTISGKIGGTCSKYWNLNREDSNTCGNGRIDQNEECECPVGTSCSCCENCKLRENAVCSPFKNECCTSQCTWKDTTGKCSLFGETGYCRNGECRTSRCPEFAYDDMCGMTSNPCRYKCMYRSYCVDPQSVFDNRVNDKSYCTTPTISTGECIAGTCQPYSGPVPTPKPTTSTNHPTPNPTNYPTPNPTNYPTPNPTNYPTPNPTNYPTPNPTNYPTPYPTNYPTPNPTNYPTPNPTNYPTPNPTNYPTPYPTNFPTPFPIDPTNNPTSYPTNYPSKFPSPFPTKYPSNYPTNYPTAYPTPYPTNYPSNFPTPYPTNYPSNFPTPYPTPEPTNERPCLKWNTMYAKLNRNPVNNLCNINKNGQEPIMFYERVWRIDRRWYDLKIECVSLSTDNFEKLKVNGRKGKNMGRFEMKLNSELKVKLSLLDDQGNKAVFKNRVLEFFDLDTNAEEIEVCGASVDPVGYALGSKTVTSYKGGCKTMASNQANDARMTSTPWKGVDTRKSFKDYVGRVYIQDDIEEIPIKIKFGNPDNEVSSSNSYDESFWALGWQYCRKWG